MFTAGGSHARLSCQQGTSLRIDMVCKRVPFFMPREHGYGSLQSIMNYKLTSTMSERNAILVKSENVCAK